MFMRDFSSFDIMLLHLELNKFSSTLYSNYASRVLNQNDNVCIFGDLS